MRWMLLLFDASRKDHPAKIDVVKQSLGVIISVGKKVIRVGFIMSKKIRFVASLKNCFVAYIIKLRQMTVVLAVSFWDHIVHI